VLFWQRSKILNNFTPRYGEIRNRGRRTVVYSLYRKIFNMSENSGYNTHTERDKYKHDLSCLGGVTVNVTNRPKVRRFKPSRGDVFLGAIKIFLRRASKAGGPMSKDFTACKNHLQVRTKILPKTIFIIPFARSSCLLPDDSAGRIGRELWYTYPEFSSVDIIPPWLSMLIYHHVDEQ
jgi:hypothetical protein